MPYLGYLGIESSKNYHHIWNQHFQIGLIAKFCKKAKMSKFETNNSLSRYFWARIFKKVLSSLKSVSSNYSKSKILKELWSYLKSAPQNLSNWKIFLKNWKCLNFLLNMHYLRSFGPDFSENYCHIWNQHPKICQFAKFP